MNIPNPAPQSSQVVTRQACMHCEGIFEHERWCVTRNANVAYAFQVVLEGSKMTLGDALILHSLGVAWPECAYDLKAVSVRRPGRFEI